MPVTVTPHDCHGGRTGHQSIETEFGIFIAPTKPDHGTGFARLSTVATTTSGQTNSDATTAGTYSEATSFLEETAENWARSDTYPTLHPEAVTVVVHPDLEGELDALDIVYHEARTHHARTNPDRESSF